MNEGSADKNEMASRLFGRKSLEYLKCHDDVSYSDDRCFHKSFHTKSQEFLNKFTDNDNVSLNCQEHHDNGMPEYLSKQEIHKSKSYGFEIPDNLKYSSKDIISNRIKSPSDIMNQTNFLSKSPPSNEPVTDDTKITELYNQLDNNNASLKNDHSNNYLQQYPEKDDSKPQAQVWETGYLFEKYASPYSPLPDSGGRCYQPFTPTQAAGCDRNRSSIEPEKEENDTKKSAPLDSSKPLSARMKAKFLELSGFSECGAGHSNNGYISSLFENDTGDCGSLGKSSSDGDHSLMIRRRPPTKLKSKRRNILSFPNHLSVDELRNAPVRLIVYFCVQTNFTFRYGLRIMKYLL